MPIKKTKKSGPIINDNTDRSMVENQSQNKQPSNLLLVLLIAVSFFAGYLFFKVQNLEKTKTSATNTAQANQPAASPLSVDNLKKYAKDMKLDTKKFNTCLDSSQKKDKVSAETAEGSGLGVQGTPGFFVNGRFLAGAFPFDFFKEIIDKELAGTASSNCKDYSANLQKYCESPDPTQRSFVPEPKTVDLGQSPVRGNTQAKITLVEYSDFQCPYCVRAYPTVKQLESAYGKDLRVVYKQYPLVNIHPFAQKAAEASLCAYDQGKFWEFYDKVFGIQQ